LTCIPNCGEIREVNVNTKPESHLKRRRRRRRSRRRRREKGKEQKKK
jgi:hypothetical protein